MIEDRVVKKKKSAVNSPSVLLQERVVHSRVKQTSSLKCLDLCRPKNSSPTPGRDPRGNWQGGEKGNSDGRKGVRFVAADKMLEGDMNTFADSLGFSLDTQNGT